MWLIIDCDFVLKSTRYDENQHIRPLSGAAHDKN
jgi:hypothetical protein